MQKWTRETKWRQGAIIHTNNCILFSGYDNFKIAVTTSHDCDIANDNLISEPYVEFVFGNIVNPINGNYEFAKNPRILHLKTMLNGEPVNIELIAHQKIQIPKEKLVDFQPNEGFKLEDRNTLQSWLTARYRRQTLPDDLVNRLKEVFKFLEKNGKNNALGILGFYLDYEPKDVELCENEAYELWLYVVYTINTSEAMINAHALAKSIEVNFDKFITNKTLQPVLLNKCQAISEQEFTLYDFRRHIEYKLEHLSNRMVPQGPIINV